MQQTTLESQIMEFRAAIPNSLLNRVSERCVDTSAYIAGAVNLYLQNRYGTDSAALDSEQNDRTWHDRPITDCPVLVQGLDHFLVLNRLGYDRRCALARRAIRLALNHH